VATLMLWQKLPEFQALFREGHRTVYNQAVARLQQGTSAAAATLLKTMIDANTPASVKIRAAEAIFNHAVSHGDPGHRSALGSARRSCRRARQAVNIWECRDESRTRSAPDAPGVQGCGS